MCTPVYLLLKREAMLQVTVMEGDTDQRVEVKRFISRELKRG